MAKRAIRGALPSANIIPFPTPLRRLRADVPPFDPTNPDHLDAWEAMFDFGRSSLEGQRHG